MGFQGSQTPSERQHYTKQEPQSSGDSADGYSQVTPGKANSLAHYTSTPPSASGKTADPAWRGLIRAEPGLTGPTQTEADRYVLAHRSASVWVNPGQVCNTAGGVTAHLSPKQGFRPFGLPAHERQRTPHQFRRINKHWESKARAL
ncbi:hypothetical protein AAFF_G00421540 [Aldrovandia affinis]|uniref:Uncharacterized protein n=1 Tax=Aldrovandia affinis TaxID=143900 RepID=A0AAD7S9Q6_9TELE|nr:hypothetical protein AAFF_G00421540 [Aldrovandia affinis]